jgi:hypothetical protein
MNNLSKLALLLNEAGRSAFDEISAKCKTPLLLDDEYTLFINKIEENLLRLMKDLKLSKEETAMLLIDDSRIYRNVAQKYLEGLK